MVTDAMDSSPRRHQRANNHYGRLGTNPAQFPWGNAVEGGKNVGDERPKVDHPIGRRLDKHDAEGLNRQVLLMRELPVHRHKRIEPGMHPKQQFAVLDPVPTQATDRLHVVTAEQAG